MNLALTGNGMPRVHTGLIEAVWHGGGDIGPAVAVLSHYPLTLHPKSMSACCCLSLSITEPCSLCPSLRQCSGSKTTYPALFPGLLPYMQASVPHLLLHLPYCATSYTTLLVTDAFVLWWLLGWQGSDKLGHSSWRRKSSF